MGNIANAGKINVNSGTMIVKSGLTDTGTSKINVSSGATLTTQQRAHQHLRRHYHKRAL